MYFSALRRTASKFIEGIAPLLFTISFLLIPWPDIFYSIYGYGMKDRLVYYDLISGYNLRVDYIDYISISEYFTNEFLWHYLMRFLNSEMNFEPETTFFLVSAFVIYVFSVTLWRRAGILGMLMLINPLFVDFAYSQLRLALAIAILGMLHIFQPKSRAIVVACVALTTMIHTSSILFAGMYAAAKMVFMARSIKIDAFWLLCLMAVGFAVSALVGPLRETILTSLEDRRADYKDMQSSVLYLSFWVVLLMLLVWDLRRSLESVESRMSIVVLSLISLNIVFGGYSTRFIAATFPFLAIAILRISKLPLNIPAFTYAAYACVQWIYWLRLI